MSTSNFDKDFRKLLKDYGINSSMLLTVDLENGLIKLAVIDNGDKEANDSKLCYVVREMIEQKLSDMLGEPSYKGNLQ